MNISEYIILKEAENSKNMIEFLEDQQKHLKEKISILYNKSVTPTSDNISKSFHLGTVGYNNKTTIKKKSRELENLISHSKNITHLESELKSIEAKIFGLKKGKVLRKNGLFVESYKYLIESIPLIQEALKTKTLKGKSLNIEELENLKDMLSSYKKKTKEREKQFLQNFQSESK